MTQAENSSIQTMLEHEVSNADYAERLAYNPRFQLMVRIMDAIEDNEDAGMCTCALKQRVNDVIDGTYVRPDYNFDTWMDEAVSEMEEETDSKHREAK